MTIPPSTSALIITLTLLLLTVASSALSPPTPLQAFTQCFLNKTLATCPSQILFTPDSASYQSILLSSAQNQRFLVSPSFQKPAAIVAATAESHVSASVVCARKHGLQLRARSGGHDYEAMSYVAEDKWSLSPQFVLVDLGALRNVDVDVHCRTAWVQAGATVGEVYYNVFTQTNGTAGAVAGFCPTIGVGGHIGGGGISTISRKYGTAADNVIDVRIVGVDGRVVNRKRMKKGLFWAIRGGGAASFGVVLSYRIKLVDVPPVVTTFGVSRNLRQNATKLVTRWQEIAPKVDKNLYIQINARKSTDGGKPSMQAVFNSIFLGNRRDLLALMDAEFSELGLHEEDCTEMNWLQSLLFINGMVGQGVEALLNRTRQSNFSFKIKSDLVTAPIAENDWGKIWEFIMAAQDQPTYFMMMEPFGGRMDEIPPMATPFPYRRGYLYIIQYLVVWGETDAKSTQRHLDWMRELYEFMTPYVSKNPRGAYYNFKDSDLSKNESAWGWGESYFGRNFEWLAYVKAKVDPDNFFRNELSIPPLCTELSSQK